LHAWLLPQDDRGNKNYLRSLHLDIIPCLEDNYAYLICDSDSETVAVGDAPEAAPIIAALDAKDWSLDYILLTHHHYDHIDGVEELREKYNCKVVGAEADAHRLPPLDKALKSDDHWDFGMRVVDVLDAPGHTVGQIAFYFERAKALFTGDSLFSLGCGRLFEGTPADMHGALSTFSALPASTKIYPGHEYTLANANFAMTIESENPALIERVAEVKSQRDKGEPTIPTTIGMERATNPFMRAHEPTVKEALGMVGADDLAVFTEIRTRKDNF